MVKGKKAKNPHAQALGHLGGLKGGRKGGAARWADVPPTERRALAQRAAAARWVCFRTRWWPAEGWLRIFAVLIG